MTHGAGNKVLNKCNKPPIPRKNRLHQLLT
jgi:hypothetical protein